MSDSVIRHDDARWLLNKLLSDDCLCCLCMYVCVWCDGGRRCAFPPYAYLGNL